MFNLISLAITFSPTGKALLKETARLKQVFNSRLLLIHAGKETPETKYNLQKMIMEAELKDNEYELVFAKGDPAAVILKITKERGCDLLISGALEQENIFKYYVGSVARKLMREAPCSVLVFKKPSLTPKPFKRFFTETDFSRESEYCIKRTHQFALLEKAEELYLIRDYNVPGLVSSVLDSGSMGRAQENRDFYQKEEEEKMRLFLKELNLKDITIRTSCLYGKEGFEAGNFAQVMNADIFSIYSPSKKYKLIDRIFPHEDEYTFEHLPTNTLIIR